MSPVYWSPLIHVYQPPTQKPYILKKIDEECYRPLFHVIDESPNARITLNINGVLIDLLYEHGLGETVELLKKIVHDGKVEIVGTAKYHPLMPLIPLKENFRQIELNEVTHKATFGEEWERKGFFPPEMAISPEVLKIIQQAGYQWVIGSGIACTDAWPYDVVHQLSNGLMMFYRDDIVSNEVSFSKLNAQGFVSKITRMYSCDDYYVITAQDGETFGHHIKHAEQTFLKKTFDLIAEDDGVEICFVTDLIQKFPVVEASAPRPSSWSTNMGDINYGVHYPLWKHPDNPIHNIQYRILDHVSELMDALDTCSDATLCNDPAYLDYKNTARYFYDIGVHSCQFWWASGNPMWSPNLILDGADLLVKAAVNARLALGKLKDIKSQELLEDVSMYYSRLLWTITEQEAQRDRLRLLPPDNVQEVSEEEEKNVEGDSN
ncbi:MAG TPA: hypothetical protein VKK79_25385 [Candidatus Lokiarchaeia archaeon]|nr:hypothetical protein [Candidatus Lokiarchaeia archaeon]